MKLNFNLYIVAFFLFCAFFSCKKNERVEENQEKAEMGSPEGDELEILALLIEKNED